MALHSWHEAWEVMNFMLCLVTFLYTPLDSRELGDCILGCAIEFLCDWQLLVVRSLLLDPWLHVAGGCLFVGTSNHEIALCPVFCFCFVFTLGFRDGYW